MIIVIRRNSAPEFPQPERSSMSKLALIAILLVASCTDPALTAGVRIGAGGVSVVPAVSGKVGGATVTVSP